jgi:hypothetical protein
MGFSKAFPRNVGTSNYPVWEEIFLTEEEEKQAEELAKKENAALMEECIDIAAKIMEKKKLKNFQSDIIRVATSLFVNILIKQ